MRRLVLVLLAHFLILLVTTLIIPTAHALTFSGYLEKVFGKRDDFHEFHLSYDGALYFMVSHDETLNPHSLRIKAPDGTQVFLENLKYNESGTVYGPYCLQAGSYTLHFSNNWIQGGEGNYTLSGTFIVPKYPNDEEPNDKPEQAQSLPYINVSTTGHLGYKTAANGSLEIDTGDWFEITFPGECDFFVTLYYGETLMPWGFRILDSNFDEKYRKILKSSEYSGEKWGPYRLQAGTYYLLISTSWVGGGYGGYALMTTYNPILDGAPWVIFTWPMPDQTNASVEHYSKEGIEVRFSESMDAESLTSLTFFCMSGLDKIQGEILSRLPVGDHIARFKPTQRLEEFTTYTCTVTTGVKDLQGQHMKNNFTWSFRTGRDPDKPRNPLPALFQLLLDSPSTDGD